MLLEQNSYCNSRGNISNNAKTSTNHTYAKFSLDQQSEPIFQEPVPSEGGILASGE